MLTIKRIISGGQTGADQGGLEAAKRFGIPTGGWIPKGFLTENGPNPKLKKLYDLKETETTNYPERTKRNVKWSDYTIIFMLKKSKGSQLTWRYAEELKKDRDMVYRFGNPLSSSGTANAIVKLHKRLGRPIVINVAGNRESSSPGISKKVAKFMLKVFERVDKLEQAMNPKE